MTYLLNRGWTFRHRAGAHRGREFTRYGLLQSLGAAINNAVYGCLLWLHPVFAAEPVLALAGGSVAAMLFNYVSARQLAFRGPVARRGPTPPWQRAGTRTGSARFLTAAPLWL